MPKLAPDMAHASRLLEYAYENNNLAEVFRRADQVQLSSWAVGAGCLTQTVWNRLLGRNANYGIKDIDLVYFDAFDLSYAAEDVVVRRLRSLFSDLPLEIDVKNQARVHLWSEQHSGKKIAPYVSLEDAIGTWPTTSNCVGIFPSENNRVYAPFGLDDLFSLVVRPNKREITEATYLQKVARWAQLWPELKILDW